MENSTVSTIFGCVYALICGTEDETKKWVQSAGDKIRKLQYAGMEINYEELG